METDQAKRNALIDDASTILQHDLPTIPLHQQVIVWAAKKSVDVAQPADNFFPYRYITVSDQTASPALRAGEAYCTLSAGTNCSHRPGRSSCAP